MHTLTENITVFFHTEVHYKNQMCTAQSGFGGGVGLQVRVRAE